MVDVVVVEMVVVVDVGQSGCVHACDWVSPSSATQSVPPLAADVTSKVRNVDPMLQLTEQLPQLPHSPTQWTEVVLVVVVLSTHPLNS